MSNSIRWLLMTVGFCLLLASFVIITVRYQSLQSEMQTVKTDNQILIQDYARLSRDFQSLHSANSDLINENNNLVGEHRSMDTEYSLLSEKFNTLTGNYSTLNDIALKPPYIFVYDRKVAAAFYGTDGELISWVTPFSDLEYEIKNGADTRHSIVDNNEQTIPVSRKDGSLVLMRDFSVFITPEAFQNVIPELYAKSSTPYDFIYQAWYMVGQLSNYVSEDTEIPRYPLETLLAGGGDCEDLAILLVSMIKMAPVDWYVDLLYVDLDNLNNPKEGNHVVVYVNTGRETFIVETTNDFDMLPYDEGVTGWLAGNLHKASNPPPVYLR